MPLGDFVKMLKARKEPETTTQTIELAREIMALHVDVESLSHSVDEFNRNVRQLKISGYAQQSRETAA